MESKHFTLSKINWVALITIIIGALSAAQSLNLSPEVMSYVVIAIGILNFVLRTFFSNSQIVVKNDTEFKG